MPPLFRIKKWAICDEPGCGREFQVFKSDSTKCPECRSQILEKKRKLKKRKLSEALCISIHQ